VRVGEGLSKRFFFGKKKQKTFFNWASGCFNSTVQFDKSFFASFFTKKEVLPLPSPSHSPSPTRT
jgi:hypothetical protein